MKTRKLKKIKKHKKTNRGQKYHNNKQTNRYKKRVKNKTRRKKGGSIPLGPVVTIGVLALAAIVGPIVGTYIDESNIEKAKREANEIMRERNERLKDDTKFSESTKEQVWDEEKRERDSTLGLIDKNEVEDDEFPPMSPEGSFLRRDRLSSRDSLI